MGENMWWKISRVILILLATTLTGCSLIVDNSNRLIEVKCYSGGKLIYKGRTKDDPTQEYHRRTAFVEDKTNIYRVITGDCVLKHFKHLEE